MQHTTLTYYHGHYGRIDWNALDPDRLMPARYGGRGMFFTSKIELAKEKGPVVYQVTLEGLVADLSVHGPDNDLFVNFTMAYPSDEREGKRYDDFAQAYGVDIIKINSQVAVVKNLGAIKQAELVK
jgi:hypothetical protein